MKKIFLFAVRLMSLLGVLLLSSCDDKSTFIEEEEFAPYGYYVKDAENIQVVGYKGLVIEETAKTDWQLYVQVDLPFVGTVPLEIAEYEHRILLDEKNSIQIDVDTNMDPIGGEKQDISYAVGGLLVNYTYLGQPDKLLCLSPLKVKLAKSVEQKNENPFLEKGQIEFSLLANDTICILKKSVPYTVAPKEYYKDGVENSTESEDE